MNRAILIMAALPVVAYLVGSIPFGLLLGRMHGVDIRQHGSGNIGATNVGRVLGRKWGFLAFGLDVAKGLIPMAVAGRVVALQAQGADVGPAGQTVAMLLVAAGCIVGHIWPVYLGFRGGKGVATSLGVLLGYWPYLTVPGLAAFATWAGLLAAARYVSLASIVAALSFPIYLAAFGWWQGWEGSRLGLLLGFSVVMAGLVVFRHRSNLSRLLAGTEPKIGTARR